MKAELNTVRPTSTWKIRIEVQPSRDSRPWWRLLRISCQQREDVIASSVSGLDHQAQIWWQCTIISRPGCLVVLIWWRDVIREFARPLLDLAFVVGLGIVLVFFGHRFHFVDCMRRANERAVGDSRKGVAGGADFAVYLEAAAEAAWRDG